MMGFDSRTRILLDAIQETGSVSAAARAVGLDASNALRHIRTAEHRAGRALVARTRGGADRGHARLTAAGLAVLDSGSEGSTWIGHAGPRDELAGVTPVRIGRRTLHAAARIPAGLVRVTIRAEDVALERPASGRGRTSVRNAVPVRVAAVTENASGTVRVDVVAGALRFAALVTRGAVRELRLREGSRVVATVKATAVRVESVG